MAIMFPCAKCMRGLLAWIVPIEPSGRCSSPAAIESLGSADFADDDAFRTHTQAVLHQIPHRYLADAFEVGGLVSDANNMGCCSCSSAASSQVITRSPRSI